MAMKVSGQREVAKKKLEKQKSVEIIEDDDDSSEEWPAVKTPQEAIDRVATTVFEFGRVILKLCEEEERINSARYKDPNTIRPSNKIKFIIGLLELFPKEKLVIHYINYVLNWAAYIEKRNVRIFMENDAIFVGAPKEYIEFFRDLWRPTSRFHLGKVEKESVFDYFDTMIHYCQVWKDMTGYVAKWELDGSGSKSGSGKA